MARTRSSPPRPPSPSGPGGADSAGSALQLAEPGWTYAPAPEARDIVSIAPEYGLFINGEFAPAADGRQFATINPATEEPLAQVADACAGRH